MSDHVHDYERRQKEIQQRHAELLEERLFDMSVDHPEPEDILAALDHLGMVLVKKIVSTIPEPSPAIKEAHDLILKYAEEEARRIKEEEMYEAAVQYIAAYEAEHGIITDGIVADVERRNADTPELCAWHVSTDRPSTFYRCGRRLGHDGDHAPSEMVHGMGSGHPWKGQS